MLNYFVFNGKSSRDFGIYIEKSPDSVHAERRGESFSVAGRNGSEVNEDSTFENYNQTYEVGWKKEFERDAYQVSNDIASWLLGSSGYCRFEDTYEPEFFRMARFANPMSVNTLLNRRYGKTKLIFDFQPQRFLKNGEKAVTAFENVNLANTITAGFHINNPFAMAANPIIRLTGRGDIRLMSEWSGLSPAVPMSGASPMSVGQNTRLAGSMTDLVFHLYSDDIVITIDCNDGRMSCDPSIIEYGTTYPELPTLYQGDNAFTLTNIGVSNPGYVTKLEIIPRWWTI